MSSELTSELAWLRRNQRLLDDRLQKIEQSLLFRMVRWPGVKYAELSSLFGRGVVKSDREYQRWLRFEKECLSADFLECRKRIAEFRHLPRLTVVLMTNGPSIPLLTRTLSSLAAQFYTEWELCICIDGIEGSSIRGLLEATSISVERVQILRSCVPCIAAALNCAGSVATGEYFAFINDGDVLAPDALYHIAETLQSHQPAILYTDEDRMGESGRRSEPLFKPSWSPQLLASTMYISRFLAISRAAFNRHGGVSGDCDEADSDLCLRISGANNDVMHIPRVLYHRMASAERDQRGISNKDAFPLCTDRQPAGTQINLGAGWMNSIVICSRSPRLLANALKSIRSRTSYAPYEIVVAEHCPGGENPEIARLADEFHCARIPIGGRFNFSTINNLASRRAVGEILIFLNDDVEPLQSSWLEALVSPFKNQDIGITGAKLLYPSGAIQHAGVVVGIGDGAGHINRHRYSGNYWKWTDESREVSAVTGACLAIRRDLFDQLGGFDAAFPDNYNDVDLCLRVWEAGRRVIYEPRAVLRHYEGQTRMLHVRYEEREQFYKRWSGILNHGDPFYNPNMSRVGEEAFLNFNIIRDELEAR